MSRWKVAESIQAAPITWSKSSSRPRPSRGSQRRWTGIRAAQETIKWCALSTSERQRGHVDERGETERWWNMMVSRRRKEHLNTRRTRRLFWRVSKTSPQVHEIRGWGLLKSGIAMRPKSQSSGRRAREERSSHWKRDTASGCTLDTCYFTYHDSNFT